MKHLIIVLVSILLLSSCRREEPIEVDFTPYKHMYVDKRLQPYVMEFIKDAHERGVDIEESLSKLVGITISAQLGNNLHGYYSRTQRVILIDKSLLSAAERYLRRVVYHEMGHALGVLHTCIDCDDIMASRPSPSFDLGRQYDTVENWEYHVDRLFESIKRVNP